jgi:hypothetical protein
MLTKTTTVTELVPAVPAQRSVPAIPFRMYATPPPLGYSYRWGFNGAIPDYVPHNKNEFLNWSQTIQPPLETYSVQTGQVFVTIESVANQSIPSSWSPVYQNIVQNGFPTTVLTGFIKPVYTTYSRPPQWYSSIGYMEFWNFDHADNGTVNYAPNGYPLENRPLKAYVDIPRVDGIERVVRTFVKNSTGFWVPNQTYPDPAYCITHGTVKVMALCDYPGRAAVASKPAVTSTDQHTGWNAGGESVTELDGDIVTRFRVQIGVAGAVGFKKAGESDSTDKDGLHFAFYFDADPAGVKRVSIMEHGRRVSGFMSYETSTTVFRIERKDRGVTYYMDDVVVYTSGVISYGAMVVGSVLYNGGDRIL